MPARTHFEVMADYNQWMNGKLYALCASLSDGERKRDRGAFFKSIHGTLNHLLYGDLAWMSRFTGQPPEVPPLGVELFSDFETMRRERERLDAEILHWATALPPEWLSRSVTHTSKVDGRSRTRPAWVLVVHFFNHQTHHRGQLTTLLTQAGVDPGVTDLSWLPSLGSDEVNVGEANA